MFKFGVGEAVTQTDCFTCREEDEAGAQRTSSELWSQFHTESPGEKISFLLTFEAICLLVTTNIKEEMTSFHRPKLRRKATASTSAA